MDTKPVFDTSTRFVVYTVRPDWQDFAYLRPEQGQIAALSEGTAQVVIKPAPQAGFVAPDQTGPHGITRIEAHVDGSSAGFLVASQDMYHAFHRACAAVSEIFDSLPIHPVLFLPPVQHLPLTQEQLDAQPF